jgi:hypothetical protein
MPLALTNTTIDIDTLTTRSMDAAEEPPTSTSTSPSTSPHTSRHTGKGMATTTNVNATANVTANATETATARLSLEFTDFVDLQTRLLLLPRVEEEGIGAVISSYQETDSPNEPAEFSSSSSSSSSFSSATDSESESSQQRQHQAHQQHQHHQHTAEPSKEHRDDVEVKSGSTKAFSPEIKMTGCVLVGIGMTRNIGTTSSPSSVQVDNDDDNNKDNNDDTAGNIVTTDFTDILACIRQQPCPIVLYFEPPPPAQQQQPSPPPQQQIQASAEPNEVLSVGMSALSAWGSRMRAQSEKYAKEAAHGAASLSTAVAVARKQQQQKQLKESESNNHKDNKECPCRMFMQSTSGAFFPVSAQKEKVTTSSLLVIRKAATEPCLSRGFSFQWYRSMTHNSDDSVSMASASGGGGGNQENNEWVLLEGATHSAFQPNATLVGRRLRCIVTTTEDDDDDDDDNSSDDDSSDTDTDDSIDHHPTQGGAAVVAVCELPDRVVVSADLTLFNGARQALARGAKFGGLTGRGNASGRTFRVEVALAVNKNNSKNSRRARAPQVVLSSLKIFQVSHNTCESLNVNANGDDDDANNDDAGGDGTNAAANSVNSANSNACPILQASATADPAISKRFDLILPMDSVKPNSMLSALITDGKFQLEAPNRLTRESFLLSLGIANFKGKPAELDATTILFREDPLTTSMMIDDHDLASMTSGSSSSVHSTTPSKASSTSSLLSLVGPVSPSHRGNLDSSTTTPPDSPASVRSVESSSEQQKTNTKTAAQDRIAEMEEEMLFLRTKLTRKDKVVSELQRQITWSETVFQKTKQSLSTTQQELTQSKQDCVQVQQSLKTAQTTIHSHEASVIRLQGDQSIRLSTFENKLLTQTDKITELEKANRNLQNEKAVLAAAVEARESKLGKMGELQESFEKLSIQVAQTETLRMELFNSNQKYADIQKELERVSQFEKTLQQDLDQAKASAEKLTTRLTEEELKTFSSQAQLASLQKKNQLLKAERNNFKQKNDSLSKEISKLCRNGRTIKEIEKIIGDHEARAHEVEALRKQKRKALEDVHMYRTSYEQSKVAQQLAGVDYETRKALERNAEMERLLSELTEYLTAKEMQLGTLKQVNAALQAEIHSLAQASLNNNEV